MIIPADNELINQGSASSGSAVNMAVCTIVSAPAKGLIVALKGTLTSRLTMEISLFLIVFYKSENIRNRFTS